MSAHRFDASILRAYDIRGVFGRTLDAEDAREIGKRFVFMQKERGLGNQVVVCRDGRLSSPDLARALIEGLRTGGAHVTDIGCGPTPMLYFAAHQLKSGGAVQVTGSHNPPDHNGFKMMMDGGPFFDDDIVALGELEHSEVDLESGSSKDECDFQTDYVARLAKGAKTAGIKVAWDCGNGAAGRIVEMLAERLEGRHEVLFPEIDGTFPNHHPDPSDERTLEALRAKVMAEGADIGIAFDGDGDRIGVIDATGRSVPGDLLTAYLAQGIAGRHPGKPVILDVKSSQVAADIIERAGAKVELWKTGHSHMKTRLRELGAPLAGEMSGHIFIADGYYGFDDAIYAGVRLLTRMVESGYAITAFMDDLPPQHATRELRIACDDKAKFEIVDKVRRHALAGRDSRDICDIDGVRVSTPNGWWLLRASNTEAALVARAEADGPDALEHLKREMGDALEAAGLTGDPAGLKR